MPRPTVPASRLFRVVVIFSAVPVGVFAALIALGKLSPVVGIVAALVVAAALAVILRRYLDDMYAIGQYVEAVARGDEEAPAPSHRGTLPELTIAFNRLHRYFRRHSEELRRLSESTETILENLPQPLILLDGHRRVVRATQLAHEVLGTNVEGQDLAALLRNPSVLEAADRVLTGGPREDVEFSVQFPVERAFNASIIRLPSPAADGTAAIVALYDLTAIKRVDQMRVDFVTNASHELKTPLSVLLSCIKTLRGAGRDDEEARTRFMGMMEAQAERMARLVEDLLSLSRIELNEHTPPQGTVDIVRVVQQVADSLEFPAGARDMKIAIGAPPDLPPVTGDEDELTQLFQNLIDNAVKYGAEGTPVTVTIGRTEEESATGMAVNGEVLSVAIANRGDGIPREHLPRLTERFYRVDTGRSRELGGTGLGLAIVKHIASRHRGALKIDSELGEGSTFTVLLPARTGQPALAEQGEKGGAA